MSDLGGIPEDQFSCAAAHLVAASVILNVSIVSSQTNDC